MTEVRLGLIGENIAASQAPRLHVLAGVGGCVKARINGEQRIRFQWSAAPVTIQNGGSMSDHRSGCRSSARLW